MPFRRNLSSTMLFVAASLSGCAISKPCLIPADLLRSVEQGTQRTFLDAPVCHEVRVSRARRQLLDSFQRKNSRQELIAEERTLINLGFLPENYPYVRRLIGEYGRRTAGFYSPEDKSLTLVKGVPDASRRRLIAHELTHAIQDQHVGIDKIITGDETTDRALAKLSILEGEAIVVMHLALGEEPCQELSLEENLLRKLRKKVIFSDEESLTKSLHLLLDFPYLFGHYHTCSLLRSGKLAELPHSYLRKELKTSDLLPWIERRTAEAEKEVLVSDVQIRAGEIAYQDSIGMFGVFALLVDASNFDHIIKIASEWRSDLATLVANKAKEKFSWVVGFNSEEAARDFFKAYLELNERRVGQIERMGQQANWESGLGRYSLSFQGQDVKYLVLSPSSDELLELLK